MASAVARLKNLSIAPRKVRLVADLIRGKKVGEARNILAFTLKKSAPELKKLLDSAVANAEHAAAEERKSLDTDEMVVSRIMVDKGLTLARFRPAPRGRAMRIRKHRSHVYIEISDSAKKN
jgi:large subunit ribosomal protein L22